MKHVPLDEFVALPVLVETKKPQVRLHLSRRVSGYPSSDSPVTINQRRLIRALPRIGGIAIGQPVRHDRFPTADRFVPGVIGVGSVT